jgi:hypothetical protein
MGQARCPPQRALTTTTTDTEALGWQRLGAFVL